TVNGTTYYILYLPGYPPTQTYLNMIKTYLMNKAHYPSLFVDKSVIYPGVLVYVPPQFLNPAFTAIDYHPIAYYTDTSLKYNSTTAINRTVTSINQAWIQRYDNDSWDINENPVPGAASSYSAWFNLTIIYPYANPLYFIPNSYFMYSLDVSVDTGWVEPVTVFDRVGPFTAYAEVTLVTPNGNYSSTATLSGNKGSSTQYLTIDFQNDKGTGESPVRFNQGYHVNMTVVATIHAKLTLTNATLNHVAGVAVANPSAGQFPGVKGFDYYSFNFFIVPNMTCLLTPNGNMVQFQNGEGPSEYCVSSNITTPASNGKYFLWYTWGGKTIYIYGYYPQSLIGAWEHINTVTGVLGVISHSFTYGYYAMRENNGVEPYFNSSVLVAWSYNRYVPSEWSGAPINEGVDRLGMSSTGYNLYDSSYLYLLANATTGLFHAIPSPYYFANINGYTGHDPNVLRGKGLFGFPPLLDTTILNYIIFRNIKPLSGVMSPLIKGKYYYFISNMSNFKQFYVVQYNYSASQLLLNGTWYVLAVIPPQFNMTSAITYLQYNTNKTFYDEYYYQAYNAHGYLASFIINNTIINQKIELTSKLNMSAFYHPTGITPLISISNLAESLPENNISLVNINGTWFEINGERTLKNIYVKNPNTNLKLYLPMSGNISNTITIPYSSSYSLMATGALYSTHLNGVLPSLYYLVPMSLTSLTNNYIYIVGKNLYYIPELTLSTDELIYRTSYMMPAFIEISPLTFKYVNSTTMDIGGTLYNYSAQSGQVNIAGIYSLQENGATYFINGSSLTFPTGTMIINYTNAICLSVDNYLYNNGVVFTVNGSNYETNGLCFSEGTYNISIYYWGSSNGNVFGVSRILLRHVNATFSPIPFNPSPIHGFNYGYVNGFAIPLNSTTLYMVLYNSSNTPNPAVLYGSYTPFAYYIPNPAVFVWRNNSLINATMYHDGIILRQVKNAPAIEVSINNSAPQRLMEYIVMVRSGNETMKIMLYSPPALLEATGIHRIMKPNTSPLFNALKYITLTTLTPPVILNSSLLLLPANPNYTLHNYAFGNFSINILNGTEYFIPINANIKNITGNTIIVSVPPVRPNSTIKAIMLNQHQAKIIVHLFYRNVSLSLPVTIIVNTPNGGVESSKTSNASGYAVFLITLPNSISLASIGTLSITLYVKGSNYTQPLQEQLSLPIQYESSTVTYPSTTTNYVITQVSGIPIIIAIILSLILMLRTMRSGIRRSRFNKKINKKTREKGKEKK
ncbi:MAG: hypothetical protein RXN93_08105, partial [Thermocladium sp.]